MSPWPVECSYIVDHLPSGRGKKWLSANWLSQQVAYNYFSRFKARSAVLLGRPARATERDPIFKKRHPFMADQLEVEHLCSLCASARVRWSASDTTFCMKNSLGGALCDLQSPCLALPGQ